MTERFRQTRNSASVAPRVLWTLRIMLCWGFLTFPSAYAGDIDHDGFPDESDSNMVSRAFIPWGDAQYLGTNDDIVYTWPNWMIFAHKVGGEWNTNLPSWVVSPVDTNEASLLMGLDRTLVTNDLAMKLDYLDTSNAVLAVDLLLPPEGANSTNEVVSVSPNVLTGLGVVTNCKVILPLAAHTNAVGIRIRRGGGEIVVFDTLLFVDQDGDGLDADQEAQLRTSDHATDSDGDGFSDYEEVLTYGTNPADSSSVPTASVSGQVLYFGVQTGTIHLLATTNTNAWSSAYAMTSAFPSPTVPLTSHITPFTIQNVPLRRTYSVRAFVDVNGDGLRDTWEPQGVAIPNITFSGATNDVLIVLADPDTDADGLPDAAELMLGLNPFVPDLCATLPFLENFETNSVMLGNLNGQNGWRSDSAQVQSNLVKEGSQAVLIDSASPTSMVRQLFARTDSSVTWVDYHTVIRALTSAPTPTNTIAAYYFDWQGRLTVWDGRLEGTNKWVTITNAAPVAAGSWARMTVALDFANQLWSVGLNGVMVGRGIGFGHPAGELHAFDMTAAWGALDQMSVSTNVPPHLSFTGNQIPDDWAQQYFGTNAVPDNGDADHDGLSNLQEYQLGTNPTNAYTAGDGIPDGWAVNHGFNPFINIATNDADGDGLSNLQEYLGGMDPNIADTDGDGILDNIELQNGTDPLLSDLIVTNGLVLDLDASRLAGFSNGDRVSSWSDRSGLGNDAYNLSGTELPVYRANDLLDGVARPVLDFNNACLQGRFGTRLTGTGLTAFVAMKVDSAAGANAGALSIANFGSGDDNNLLSAALFIGDTPANLRWAGRRANLLGSTGVGPLREAVWQILATRFDGATNTLYVGGAAQAGSPSSGAFGSDSFTVGRRQPLTSYVNGQYGEVLVYNRALSDPERLRVESYLRHKWLGASSSSADSSFTIPSSAGLTVALTSPINGAVFAPGEPITLSVSVSDTATVRKVEFYAGNTLLATSHVSPFTSDISLPSGAYTLVAKAYTGDGTVADSVPVPISVLLDGTGLQAWWPLNQPDGSTIMDASGNGHTATLMNGPAWVGTPGGSAFAFDGVNDFGTALLDVSETNYSVSIWFKTTSANAGLYMVVDGDLGNGGNDRTLYLNGGNLFVRTWNSEVISTVGLNLADGRWHHVVHTYGGAVGAQGGQRLYVDGALKAVGARAQSDFYWQKRVNFGYCADAAQPFFNGQLADIRIYNQAISPAVVAALALLSPAQSGPDTDGDSLPDSWERAFFGNLDQGAEGDPDHDGLTNLQEYRLGTNPVRPDTDGDGMPDGWEIQKGFNPMDPSDGALDADGDGLSNAAEYQAGTNPHNADTDADGVCDGDEVNVYMSDPNSVSEGNPYPVAAVNGAQTNSVVGMWEVVGSQLLAVSRRGSVEYVLQVPTSGVYQVELEGGQGNPNANDSGFKILGYVDDVYVGKDLLSSPYVLNGTAHFMTPFLAGGEHRFRFFWDNVVDGPKLRISVVRLRMLDGTDADGNGRPDWVDYRLAHSCTLESPMTSLVSPACLEGRGLYPELMSLTCGVMTGAVPVKALEGGRWYANVPLNPIEPMPVIVSFQNGARVITNSIEWKTINLLTASNLMVRRGDAVKFTAEPDGVVTGGVTVAISGGPGYETVPGMPVIYPFLTAGVYTVQGVYAGETAVSNSITVTVVGGGLPTNSPVCWWGMNRVWDCPLLAPEAVVDSSADIVVSDYGVPSVGRRLLLCLEEGDAAHYVTVRLGQGGAILDSRRVTGTWVRRGSDGQYFAAEHLSDGGEVSTLRINTGNFPATAHLVISIFSGGNVFDDGSVSKVLTAADFDILGECPVRLIRPPGASTSFCHHMYLYDGQDFVGSR